MRGQEEGTLHPLFEPGKSIKFVVEVGVQGGERERTQAECLNECVSWNCVIICVQFACVCGAVVPVDVPRMSLLPGLQMAPGAWKGRLGPGV